MKNKIRAFEKIFKEESVIYDKVYGNEHIYLKISDPIHSSAIMIVFDKNDGHFMGVTNDERYNY